MRKGFWERIKQKILSRGILIKKLIVCLMKICRNIHENINKMVMGSFNNSKTIFSYSIL